MLAATPSHRTVSTNRVIIAVPPLLGVVLALTNRWFPAVDDECAIIDRAAHPVSETLRLYFSGAGEHEHPPLYDLILHGWLRLTGGEMHLLRVPAILFYVLGAWALVAATKRLAGGSGGRWALILVALWPFGFHFGRLAAWYSFCFFLVSLLTGVYLVYLESPTLAHWTWVIVCALLLVYSNYFGWALLGFLALDFAIRDPRAIFRQWRRLFVGSVALLLLYLPILAAFVREIHRGVRTPISILAMLFTGIYNLYCIFVSESVAPWFWALGVPAGIAIAACLILALWHAPLAAKRFLIYFLGLLAVMAFLGVVETKRLLFIAPWLILPVAATLGALSQTSRSRLALVLALAVVAAIGWYGIFARNLYAAPHWVEPWPEIAQQAANIARGGGVAIGNNASFFSYMTYMIPAPSQQGTSTYFLGLLPESTRRPGVYNPQQWLAEGQPMPPTVLLVKGLHFGNPEGPTDETERSLNTNCVLQDSRRMAYDPGAAWKQRFAPNAGQIPWRIQMLTYACPRESPPQKP